MISFVLSLPLSARCLAFSSVSPSSCASGQKLCQSQRLRQTGSKMVTMSGVSAPPGAKNVLGGPLELCCNSPRTGWYRDGHCHTGPQDLGVHTVCARVTDDFLQFSRDQGNDLITPALQYGFPGLKEGDGWCVCASRWLDAARAGRACPIVLASTHEKTLEIVPLDLLRQHAIDA